MRKTADYGFEFQGSTMHLRVWEGEGEQDRPIVVVEPGRGVPFEKNRLDLANDLATATQTKPENLQWYEQGADGKMKQYEFKPYEFEHRPYANDLSRNDYEAAERKGELKPDIIKGHHAIETAVSPEKRQELDTRVGERVDSYEQRQKRDWDQEPER